MVSKLAARSRWSRGATPANDRSAASPLTRASVSVLASWLASWGAATGPDVSGFMAVLRDMRRFHGVQARRSSCPADGYISPCLSLCPPNDGIGRSVASAETAIDTPMSPAGSVHQSRRGSQRGEQDPSLLRRTGAELDHSVGRTPAGDVVGAIHVVEVTSREITSGKVCQ